jgi:hypothetical protein
LHWVLLHTKNAQTTLLFDSTLLKHGRHFDYWNKLLNMRMRVCYLDYHEAGLCCYLVIQKAYYVYYNCFTSIYDLFTDSPSYLQLERTKDHDLWHHLVCVPVCIYLCSLCMWKMNHCFVRLQSDVLTQLACSLDTCEGEEASWQLACRAPTH